MTDREMLELAAKAAGYYFHGLRVGLDYENCFVSATNDPDDWVIWDPRGDDGDALRLAVQCGILNLDDALFYGDRDIDYQTDPYAATRRAITRAAAEIGRQKEETK